MKLPKEEKERYQKAFQEMSPLKKLDYILTYYRLALSLIAIFVIFISAVLYITLTSKNIVVYTGLVNVEVGSDLYNDLTTNFVEENGLSVKKDAVEVYQGLYLTSDPASEVFQYVYASRLKVLAAIESKELDVVLMNQEAYDSFSQSGYLLDLTTTGLTDVFPADAFVTNLVIYDDNAEAAAFDETIPYEAVTGEEQNAISAENLSILRDAGFPKDVYAGIIANTERLEMVEQYLAYLK